MNEQCLDNTKNTRIVVGHSTKTLDEFSEMLKRDKEFKEKMDIIDEKLKEY